MLRVRAHGAGAGAADVARAGREGRDGGHVDRGALGVCKTYATQLADARVATEQTIFEPRRRQPSSPFARAASICP